MLKEIRIHGRGGQGAVTLGELIAISAFYEGRQVQAFPSFGVERQGAPVESYVRISNKPIARHDQVKNPDYIVFLDDTLLADEVVFQGLDKGDIVVVNSIKSEDEVKKFFSIYPDIKVKVIDATSLAISILGKPLPNTATLAAFASATELISLKSIKKAVVDKFGEKGRGVVDKNIEIIEKTFEHIDPKSKFVVIPSEMDVVPYEGERYGVAG